MGRNPECEKTQAQINAFLDNELAAREAVRMTRHLETCVPCRHEYEQIKAVRAAVRTLPMPEAALSEAIKVRAFNRFEQSLRQPAVRQSFWERLLSEQWLRPLTATMAIAVVAGTTFLLWPDNDFASSGNGSGSVSAPTTAEWDNLFHRHDAQAIAFSADDPALRRDLAAEAHASLLRQADEVVTGSL